MQDLVNEKSLEIVVQVARQTGMLPIDSDKVRMMSHHNIINNLLEIAKHFAHSDDTNIVDFCPYIVHYFINKYDKRSQCAHAFYTHLYSWMRTLSTSMQCRLLATMLEGYRGTRATIRHYLRIRREITKNNPMELLDQIFLAHEEAIAIVHRLYDPSKKAFICKWLNDFYININYKQVNNAKLQSSIFVEFLLNCHGQMTSFEKEVRITNKQSRKVNPGLFTSRIDKNNGFSIIKFKRETVIYPNSDRLFKSKVGYNKTTARTPEKNASRHESGNRYRTSQSRENNREHLSQLHSNQIDNRLFDVIHESPDKSQNNELSPVRLFKTAGKSLMKLNRIDQELDSRRSNNPSPTYMRQQRQKPRDHFSEHSSNNIRELSSSNLVEKYSEDWERMIERNENFKEKMLRKSRCIVDRNKKLLQENSVDLKDDRESHFHERIDKQSDLHANLQEVDEKEAMPHFSNTFKTVDIHKQGIPFHQNFSFKDSIDFEEHTKIPEIRESLGVKSHFT